MKCFFPVENFHFGRLKANFSGFEKWQAKKKKKRSSPHFITFPPYIFNFPTFLFTIFLFLLNFHPFPFFPCLFFPGRSAEISRSEVSGGTFPPTCYATDSQIHIILIETLNLESLYEHSWIFFSFQWHWTYLVLLKKWQTIYTHEGRDSQHALFLHESNNCRCKQSQKYTSLSCCGNPVEVVPFRILPVAMTRSIWHAWKGSIRFLHN